MSDTVTTIEAAGILGYRSPHVSSELAPLPHTLPPPRGRHSEILGRRPRLYQRQHIELARQFIAAGLSRQAAINAAAAIVSGKVIVGGAR